jgi:predicted RNase H-like HicB family nuclease
VTDSNRYPAEVFWSEEDSGFIAIAPDLPGCSAFGLTQQEALAELQDAMAAWIEAAHSAGNPIPEPSDPAREADYSGKVLLRMPRDLHARLARLAKTETVSLNQYIVYLLTRASTHRSIEISVFGTLRPPVTERTTVAINLVTANLGQVSMGTTGLWHQEINTFPQGATGAILLVAGPIAIAGGTTVTIAGGAAMEKLRQEARHG